MLLSFRKRLTIALCPTHIAVAERGRGWRRQFSEPIALSAETVDGASDWHKPLAILALWLEQKKPGRADVEVILSDDFVRYALVPWSDDVQKNSELAAFARIHFESLFGSPCFDWDIQTDRGDYGKPGIGCALDKKFIAALQTLLSAHGLRLVLLQPYFLHVFNRWRSRIVGDALFAAVDAGLCVIATFKDRHWHSIRSVRLCGNADAELTELVERELLLRGLDAQTAVFLHMLAPIDASALKRGRHAALLDTAKSAARQAAGQTMLFCRGR